MAKRVKKITSKEITESEKKAERDTPKKVKEVKVAEPKRKVIDFGARMDPVKYRLLKMAYKLKDNDLITESDFKAKREKMYGKRR
jgi:hypothetical protein